MSNLRLPVKIPERILDELSEIEECASGIYHLLVNSDFSCNQMNGSVACLLKKSILQPIEKILDSHRDSIFHDEEENEE